MTPVFQRALFGALLAAAVSAQAQGTPPSTTLTPLVVTASRAARPIAESPHAVEVFAPERFRRSPASTVDDVLRESAAFSLFRRSSSLYANPTAQGVSLRGIGPSGASRTLVLLDGIPLNDPFGGWVAWAKVPREALRGAEIVRGGGSGAWGNAALGGVIQLFTHPDEPPPTTEGSAAFSAGSFNTLNADMAAIVATANGSLRLAANAFRTHGFHALADADRGPVDETLESSHETVQATFDTAVGETLRLTLTARWFDEARGNGTALQENFSRESLVALGVTGRPPDGPQWRADLYFQRQNFDSFFSAVNATRTLETPANHQFDVPAKAAGASWSGSWRHASGTTAAGADIRWVEGRTVENFLFGAGGFARERAAGGRQRFAGAFVNHDRALGDGWRASGGVRIDRWENRDAFRRESDRATGGVLRNDRTAKADGWELSPHAGLVWQANETWRARASVYRAFRVPTLNEYHRPFRVGIISTEANPTLREETLDGAEIGFDFTTPAFAAGITGFANRLHDAVANVTLSRTPSAIARQRQNVDRVAVAGVEVRGEWRPVPSVRVSANWLCSDAEIGEATAQPSLAGRRLAQVPRHTIGIGVDWQAGEAINAALRARHGSGQFEDDENLFALAAATTIDLMLSWRAGERMELFLAAENLGDERVQTGRSNEGIVSYGMPRNFRGGVRLTW